MVRSLNFSQSAFDFSLANTLLENMEKKARGIVAPGALGAKLQVHRSVEMRYLGQGHEISVPLPARTLRVLQMWAISWPK